jgi:hypothetical protein
MDALLRATAGQHIKLILGKALRADRPTKSPAQNSDFVAEEIKARAEGKQRSWQQKPEAVMDEAN